ncbi:MAG TPA: histidine phosphatase family protein [Candidatus Limnocylindrales bacterium]|nr:histidine phosphatase family protein [Candidatus Limnocylindrales bacterium]
MSDAVELYLLRHADAGDPGAWRGADADRPLSSKGEKQCERLGSFLLGIGFRPDAILSSPKLRAMQTAERVGDRLGVDVQAEHALADGTGVDDVERLLAEAGNVRRVMIVGHDPDFSSLLGTLCDFDRATMKKGALARIDARRPLAPGSGELRWLVPPDLLKPA